MFHLEPENKALERFLLKIILGRYWFGSLDFASFWKKPCVRLQISEMHSDYGRIAIMTRWRFQVFIMEGDDVMDVWKKSPFFVAHWHLFNRDNITIHGIPNKIKLVASCSHTHTHVESEWFGKEARINKKRLTYAWPGQKHETLWVFPWNMPADINRAAENEPETPQHRKRRKNTCLLTCNVIARALGVQLQTFNGMPQVQAVSGPYCQAHCWHPHPGLHRFPVSWCSTGPWIRSSGTASSLNKNMGKCDDGRSWVQNWQQTSRNIMFENLSTWSCCKSP